ncbi:hypothetical protein niasHT_022699 [Heterodera trifolii]|uniref:Protein DPCD n=1 Tax=Heterodera trifolii TaxID=157864 RepID=A0ABD2KMT0_9BILA
MFEFKDSSVNFDSFLLEVGASQTARTTANRVKHVLDFVVDDECRKWQVKSNPSTFTSWDCGFELNTHFDSQTRDGRKVTQHFTYENNQLLTEKQSWTVSPIEKTMMKKYEVVEEGHTEKLTIEMTSGAIVAWQTRWALNMVSPPVFMPTNRVEMPVHSVDEYLCQADGKPVDEGEYREEVFVKPLIPKGGAGQNVDGLILRPQRFFYRQNSNILLRRGPAPGGLCLLVFGQTLLYFLTTKMQRRDSENETVAEEEASGTTRCPRQCC